MDIIETKHVYLNIGGIYTFGFWPNIKSKSADIEDSKESETKRNHIRRSESRR